MKFGIIWIVLAALNVFIFGCAQTADYAQQDAIGKGTEVRANDAQAEPQLKQLADNYYRFDKAHYEKSLEDGKVIFLDFHANWCPICAAERPKILAAFNELGNENVVGYQVHYNDRETNADDEEMAKNFGITYQHTKVIIDSNGNVALRSLEVFSKEKVIEEISKVA